MQFEKKEEEIEIDLRELLFEFLGHWKVIVLSVVIVGMIALVISKFLLTPQYEATARLYVLSKSTSITSLADIQMGSSLTNDYMVVVTGRPVAEQVIENLDLEEEYSELLGKITVNNPTDSRILEISVQDEDPKRAKEIADEMAKVSSAFIADKMDQDAPTLIQKGYADGLPVRPNVMKNTAIGAFIGLLLALATITISYLLNDTIMLVEDVEERLGLHILGTLPLEEDEVVVHKNKARKRLSRKSA